MNNAKMWLVVKPTVGVPLFLTAVAVSSFAVHVAVLSKTNWYNDYLVGKELGSGMASATSDAVLPKVASYLPEGSQEVLVTLPDGTTARAILQMPATMAALK
ncbi:MAG: light-harvesting protein [Rhodobacteraceae bacterium]|jgi:light-harvesting protein B-800-850 alpha chain|nr:light-harvesting protein [Paracoccaceae bacterium]MCF8513615.1 light-harvesting protein [Paracoccaceae bacterium]MCF8517485.1 light-harvesting protein [Paracoccaceae bacterium]